MKLSIGKTFTVYRLTNGEGNSIEYGKFTVLLDDLKERIEEFEEPVRSFTIEELTVDQSQVIEAFQRELDENMERYNWHELRGYGSAWLDPIKNNIEYLERSIARLTA